MQCSQTGFFRRGNDGGGGGGGGDGRWRGGGGGDGRCWRGGVERGRLRRRKDESLTPIQMLLGAGGITPQEQRREQLRERHRMEERRRRERIRLAKAGGHALPDLRKVKRDERDSYIDRETGAYFEKHLKTGASGDVAGAAGGKASSTASCETSEADGDAKASDAKAGAAKGGNALLQLASLATANLGSPVRGEELAPVEI